MEEADKYIGPNDVAKLRKKLPAPAFRSAARRARDSLGADFAAFGFSAAAVTAGTGFEGPEEVFVDAAYHGGWASVAPLRRALNNNGRA